MNPTCPHTDATLAWLYGEGDENHLTHVGSCAACQALVAEHEEVLAAVQPVMPLVTAPGTVATPEPANGTRWFVFAPAVALAASALLVVGLWGTGSPGPSRTIDPVSPPVPVASVDFPEDLDLGLDDLDAEIDDLFADLEAL